MTPAATRAPRATAGGLTRPVAVAVVLALAVLAVAEATRPAVGSVAGVDLATVLDDQVLRRSTAFRTPLHWAGLLAVVLRILTGLALLAWAVRRPDGDPPHGWRRVVGGMVAAAAAWAVTDLVRAPIGLWAWDRSVAVGLSTQPLAAWARDWVVVRGLQWLGVGVAAGLGLQLRTVLRRRRWGRRAWGPVVGVAGGLAGAALAVLSPVVLEPLLLRTEPLPDGALAQQITVVAARAGLADVEVVVADASRRTTASNAYVSGLGLPGLGTTRRIVLFDTLLRDAPADQVLAVVAHEVAHDRHRDLERSALGLVAVSALLGCALQVAVDRAAPDQAGPRHAVLAVGLVVVLLAALGPVERWSSRRAEAAADAAAVALTQDPAAYRSMLIGLAQRNLADPAPPSWSVLLQASHPPLGQRIARAAATDVE